MILEQYSLACLSQNSYLVADETSKRAVIIDPRRDVDLYLEEAERLDLRIAWVVLTHFHADFL
ncbi:MAG: MBL fold metallo-hydrolase, partial [Planctomycetota bacterium]